MYKYKLVGKLRIMLYYQQNTLVLRMLKLYKIIVFTSAVIFATTCFASTKAADTDYDANYYSDEGRVNFKMRGFGSITKSKQSGLPAPTSIRSRSGAAANADLLINGYGIEGATDLFFGDHVAVECALGWGAYNISRASLANIAYNYSDTAVVSKKQRLYAIPLTFTAQYHIAPFGAIRPYVGGGYGGTYLFSKAKEFKIKNAHGMVIQIGTDFVMTDDTLLNLDIKRYSLSPKITYKGSFVNNNKVAPKVKMDPIVISAGIGIKF